MNNGRAALCESDSVCADKRRISVRASEFYSVGKQRTLREHTQIAQMRNRGLPRALPYQFGFSVRLAAMQPERHPERFCRLGCLQYELVRAGFDGRGHQQPGDQAALRAAVALDECDGVGKASHPRRLIRDLAALSVAMDDIHEGTETRSEKHPQTQFASQTRN